jgi:hypothetical protein
LYPNIRQRKFLFALHGFYKYTRRVEVAEEGPAPPATMTELAPSNSLMDRSDIGTKAKYRSKNKPACSQTINFNTKKEGYRTILYACMFSTINLQIIQH